jgi:hypothetical protein
MGMQEAPAGAPDTYGLPEYRVSEMRIETDGNDVRMVFGAKRFGQINWLYTVVVCPEKLMEFCGECQSISEQMFGLRHMLERRPRGH